jgi:hypothetical protein
MTELHVDTAALELTAAQYGSIMMDLQVVLQRVEATATELAGNLQGQTGDATQQALARYIEAVQQQITLHYQIEGDMQMSAAHYTGTDTEQSQILAGQMQLGTVHAASFKTDVPTDPPPIPVTPDTLAGNPVDPTLTPPILPAHGSPIGPAGAGVPTDPTLTPPIGPAASPSLLPAKGPGERPLDLDHCDGLDKTAGVAGAATGVPAIVQGIGDMLSGSPVKGETEIVTGLVTIGLAGNAVRNCAK